MRQTIDSTFKLSEGGLARKAVTRILNGLEKEYGSVTEGRLVDFCIRSVYMNRNKRRQPINVLFASKYITMLKQAGNGMFYYEDQWLKDYGLSRDKLIHLIIDRSKHPLAVYISMPAEESTKQRMHNEEMGYTLCQISTLGWSPTSESCASCNFIVRCKENTRTKYPELYRIREEYERSEQ